MKNRKCHKSRKLEEFLAEGCIVLMLGACQSADTKGEDADTQSVIETTDNEGLSERELQPEIGMYVTKEDTAQTDFQNAVKNCGYTLSQMCIVTDDKLHESVLRQMIEKGCQLLIIHTDGTDLPVDMFEANPEIQFLVHSPEPIDLQNVSTYVIDDSNIETMQVSLGELLEHFNYEVTAQSLTYSETYAPIYEEALTIYQEMQVLGDIHYAWDAAQNCIIFHGVTEHQTDEAFMTQWKEIMEEYTNDDNLIYD